MKNLFLAICATTFVTTCLIMRPPVLRAQTFAQAVCSNVDPACSGTNTYCVSGISYYYDNIYYGPRNTCATNGSQNQCVQTQLPCYKIIWYSYSPCSAGNKVGSSQTTHSLCN
jgi:hypothetical protein